MEGDSTDKFLSDNEEKLPQCLRYDDDAQRQQQQLHDLDLNGYGNDEKMMKRTTTTI